jgi:hypothetical protein
MWEQTTNLQNGPFQDLTQEPYKYKNGPYQCLKPQDMPANHKSDYFQESQGVMWEHPKNPQRPFSGPYPKTLQI